MKKELSTIFKQNPRLKLFTIIAGILFIVALPLLILVSGQRQDIRQRAAAGEDVSFFYTSFTGSSPITQVTVVQGNQVQVKLFLNAGSRVISAFDITIEPKNGLVAETLTPGVDAAKFNTSLVQTIDRQNNTIHFAKVNWQTATPASGSLHVATLTFSAPASLAITTTGTVDMTKALVTGTANPQDYLTVSKPTLAYTIISTATNTPGPSATPTNSPTPTRTPTPSPLVSPTRAVNPFSATISGPRAGTRNFQTTVGTPFPANSFKGNAQVFADQTLTSTSIVVVKVFDDEDIPVPPDDTQYACVSPNQLITTGNAPFFGRYCMIAQLTGLTTAQALPFSRAWTPTEQGTYLVYINAASATNSCTGKPFVSNRAQVRCSLGENDYITVNVLPAPSGTATPTSTPTITPRATTITQNPSITLTTGNLMLNFDLRLQGIGGSGTKQPIHLQREIKVQLFNTQNQKVAENSAVVTFSSTTGTFTGPLTVIPTLPAGNYIIKVSTPRYLTATIGQTTNTLNQFLIPGVAYTVPLTTLVAGDVNGDNEIDIKDFNMLRDCGAFAAKNPPSIERSGAKDPFNSAACNAHDKINTDINDDGFVNLLDAQLFEFGIATRKGS